MARNQGGRMVGHALAPRPGVTPRLTGSLAIVLAVLGAATTARADVIVRGTVVKLEAGEMYFDLGHASGLTPGATIRMKRTIRLKHPVTGKLVEDELPLGTLTVSLVGDELSMAIPTDALLYPAEIGDYVEALIAREEKPLPKVVKPKPVTPPPPPEPPLPAVDAATARVLAVWQRTSGASVDDRIAAWEHYLEEDPDSAYGDAVRAELVQLRTLKEELAERATGATASEPAVSGVAHASPTRWRWHTPMGLSFATHDRSIRAAWLHYRRRGSDTFKKKELAPDGDGYLRTRLADADADAPGVEYFVEVLTDKGVVGSAVGTPEEPVAVAIDAPRGAEIFAPRPRRSRISLTSAYLDFATFDRRTGAAYHDTVSMFEADFFYGLRRHLYGMRMGMGVMNGHGGFRNPADPDAALPTRAFNYGYTELELRATDNLALLARAVVGVGTNGLGGGAEGRVRLGPEDATNLTFGVSSLAEIGFLTDLKLSWAVFPRFPIGLGIALTNQPNPGGDLAVRFAADVGVKVVPWGHPTIGISYQGRSVEHSGLGASLGMVFDW